MNHNRQRPTEKGQPRPPGIINQFGLATGSLAMFFALVQLGSPILSDAATIWTGPIITFTDVAGSDPTLPADQDRLTPNVWITRGSQFGLYNAKTETGFTHFLSPADTQWADGTTANYSSLSYTDWNTWAKNIHGGPPGTVGLNAVVHLISDDVYLDIKFTSWGGAGGGFSYQRSTPASGNQPPSVSITTPANGASFIAPANVNIQAAASDPDGSITNVQFFDGVTSLGNVTSAPFNIGVSLALGSHTLTAVASDNLGATTTSTAVTVTVIPNSPPTVSIISPTDGASFIAPANVTIQAAASDPDGSITNVQFFDGVTSLGNVASPPFNIGVSLALGSHTLTAVASDNLGATTTSTAVTVTVIPNSPPTVSIISPTDGASFIAPANVTIQAAASDPDGSIASVQFFDGVTSLGNVPSAPFNITVSLAPGSHTLTAVASDDRGATTTSAPVTVTVLSNSPPTISLTSPTSGASFIAPVNVTLQAAASDPDGTVTNVQFFDGATLVGNATASPYSISASLGLGTHTLTAVASDNLGATTTSAPVTVTVLSNFPPTVSLTSPTNGASFIAPANVNIQATASDPDGTVTNVQFFDGVTSLGNATSIPYGISASLVLGSHTLTAVASDNLGATTTSASVTVTVISNFPPTVSLTSPTNGASFISPANVNIQAAAGDADGAVTNVQFFDGATSLGNAASPPYSMSVSLALGSHTLTAVASDNMGATTTSASVTVTVISNSPPTVGLTSPTNGASFIAPGNVNIQAIASDLDGTVTNVQFFDGVASLGNATASPYSIFASLGLGSHTLTAVASDNLAATTTSASVTVTVISNFPPTVSLTSPTNGASFIDPGNVNIQATASDLDGTVTNVQFFDGATSLGNATASPYSIFASLGLGSHTLTAVASDNVGATTTSASVTVTVISNSPPTVSIINPVDGASFTAPATIIIAAAASDLDGSVMNVQFFDGATALGNATNSPYSILASLSVGTHTLTAKASDDLGATTSSAIATVTVASNAPPNQPALTGIHRTNTFAVAPAVSITNGSLRFTWQGDANDQFDLLYAQGLGSNVLWQLAQPSIAGSPSGSNSFIDPPYLASPAYAPNSNLFYRLRALPPQAPGLALAFQIVASNLVSPTVLTHAHDGSGRLFIADQVGQIRLLDNAGNLLPTPFLDISRRMITLSTNYDERGLLGLAFHPGYVTNGRFFVYYAAPSPDTNFNNMTVLSEFRVSGTDTNRADPTSERVLLTINEPEFNHEGADIVFGPDGYLYLGPGDGGGAGDQQGTTGNAQSLTTLLGKIVRIDVDSGSPYAIPLDNPFVSTVGARPEIYAYGLRNPWRFSFDRGGTHQGFIADVGQNLYEELDILRSGANYGWRILEGNHAYDPGVATILGVDVASLDFPVFEYAHGPLGISIIGGFVYRGGGYPDLVGKYIFGDFSTSFAAPDGQLYYLDQTRPGIWERFSFQLWPDGGRLGRFIKGFGEDEAGEIYMLSTTTLGPTGNTGDIRRLVRP